MLTSSDRGECVSRLVSQKANLAVGESDSRLRNLVCKLGSNGESDSSTIREESIKQSGREHVSQSVKEAGQTVREESVCKEGVSQSVSGEEGQTVGEEPVT
jgi:hypothetical protein